VYFWRWALWKVFEQSGGPGIVCFITAASYLCGPGFVGMREHMRRTLDELWILDLEGDSLGARKTKNVFNIQTPVAIALGVRYGEPKPNEPARVHYAKLEGTREGKLEQLAAI
jgi:predicted helicase